MRIRVPLSSALVVARQPFTVAVSRQRARLFAVNGLGAYSRTSCHAVRGLSHRSHAS
jgi:hypothetical protein